MIFTYLRNANDMLLKLFRRQIELQKRFKISSDRARNDLSIHLFINQVLPMLITMLVCSDISFVILPAENYTRDSLLGAEPLYDHAGSRLIYIH